MAQSAQDFIRALKAHADPPDTTKINLAISVWSDQSFNVPNKAETIAEFILTRLLKDKDNANDSDSALLDIRYWKLLENILVHSSKQSPTARPLKPWLLPLLNRTPLAPVVIASLNPSSHPSLLPVACRCMTICWPVASPKFTSDTLLDCYTAAVRLMTSQFWKTLEDGEVASVTSLLRVIISSYKSSLSNCSAKKKVYQTFLRNTIEAWFAVVVPQNDDASQVLTIRSEAYDAGIETMFNLEVLRQVADNSDQSLEEALARVVIRREDISVHALPRLFHSYIAAVHKYRGALFGQTSSHTSSGSLEQVKIATMKFFAAASSLAGIIGNAQAIWQTRLALLQVVDTEGLLSFSNEFAVATLLQLSRDACVTFDPEVPVVADLLLLLLATMIHLDYDLVMPTLSHFLTKLVAMTDAPESAFLLLNNLISYHTKSRTMDGLVDILVEACSVNTAEPILGTPNVSVTGSNPVAHCKFLAQLSNAIQGFATPNQVQRIADSVLGALRSAMEGLKGSAMAQGGKDEERPKKRKKVQKSGAVLFDGNSRNIAVSFSLLAGISTSALTSLPVHILADDVRQAVLDSLEECLDVLDHAVLARIDRVVDSENQDTWSEAVVVSAALRMRYSLRSEGRFELGHSPTKTGQKITKVLSRLLDAENVLPELRVETVRTLLLNVQQQGLDVTPLFNKILDFLDRWIPSHDDSWSGSMDSLRSRNTNQTQAALAILYVILGRWMSVFDAPVTQDQCSRIARLLLDIQKRSQDDLRSELTFGIILQRTMHNAEFWESHNLRDVLLQEVSQMAEDLDTMATSEGTSLPSTVMPVVSAIFGLVLNAPMDYLPRKIRSDLVQRALAADLALGPTGDDRIVTMLRQFLLRTFRHVGTVEHNHVGTYLIFLMETSNDSADAAEATMQLMRMHLSAAVKAASKGDHDVLLQVIKSVVDFLTPKASTEQSFRPIMRMEAFMQLVSVLTEEHAVDNFHLDIVQHLVSLQEHLRSVLHSRLFELAKLKSSSYHDSHGVLLDLWYCYLLLNNFLRIDDVQDPSFGAILAAKWLSYSEEELRPAMLETTFRIMQEDIRRMHSAAVQDRLSSLLATYLAFSHRRSCLAVDNMDASLARLFRKMPVSDFAVVLEVISEGQSAQDLDEGDTQSLVHLSTITMHNAPEGSLKLTQNHLTRSLILFADQLVSIKGVPLRDHIIEFMNKQFNERPATVRQQDMSSIWAILGSCLVGSTSHDSRTSNTALSTIVSIISALIRLRRDLISSTLPHLGLILRNLIKSLRRLRPHLGAQQSRLVADTLPRWINPVQPAQVDDSRAIARLLTTLTTKTIVRTFGTAATTQKAVSLARPFSKHAGYVLRAYIEAVNDPLCVLPAEIRREMEPGLFALCDMMGENNRDSIMITALDAGGKAVMKGIWREYEKQKYVGKG